MSNDKEVNNDKKKSLVEKYKEIERHIEDGIFENDAVALVGLSLEDHEAIKRQNPKVKKAIDLAILKFRTSIMKKVNAMAMEGDKTALLWLMEKNPAFAKGQLSTDEEDPIKSFLRDIQKESKSPIKK